MHVSVACHADAPDGGHPADLMLFEHLLYGRAGKPKSLGHGRAGELTMGRVEPVSQMFQGAESGGRGAIVVGATRSRALFRSPLAAIICDQRGAPARRSLARPGRSRHDPRRQSAAHRSLPAQHGPGLPGPRRDEDGGVRILHAVVAGAAPFSHGGRARAGAGIPRDAALLVRGARLARRDRPLRTAADRLPGVAALHRRRARDGGGNDLLSERADPAGDGAAAAGPADREPRDEHPAFPDDDRRQGGARRARGGQAAGGRLWLPPRARRRGRPDGGAGELHRRLRRHRHGAGRAALRHPDLRHHGAFVHRAHDDEATAFENFARSRPTT